jgi:hypothetical protein
MILDRRRELKRLTCPAYDVGSNRNDTTHFTPAHRSIRLAADTTQSSLCGTNSASTELSEAGIEEHTARFGNIPLRTDAMTRCFAHHTQQNMRMDSQQRAGWAYAKCAMLFFAALLVTWVSHDKYLL